MVETSNGPQVVALVQQMLRCLVRVWAKDDRRTFTAGLVAFVDSQITRFCIPFTHVSDHILASAFEGRKYGLDRPIVRIPLLAGNDINWMHNVSLA